MLLLIISFIAGVLTVLAPCILPLLPVIIGGSLGGGGVNKKKAFTIIASLGVSVILFTLLLKVSTLFIHIPEVTWTYISGGIIILIGLVTIFPTLWEGQVMARLSTKANILLGKGEQKHNFWGDVIIGAALGPVFSSCSPTYFIVLATVLPVNPALGMVYLLAYTIGLCLSLFVVSLVGQKLMGKLGVASDPRGYIKKTLGVLFLIVGVAILFGFDKKIQTSILESGFFDITKVEQKLLTLNDKNKNENTDSSSKVVNENTDTVEGTTTGGNTSIVKEESKTTIPKSKTNYLTQAQKQIKYKKVPELVAPDGFINTNGQPITLAELKGKVVLLDIWTYSCINCQRTIPYIVDWYSKYKDEGFVVVGVHTPEFGFEKVQANVEKAVAKFGIKYPVILDNNYQTWNALGNSYWPRKYLIDIDGYIVYDHIGEGEYDVTERKIQDALKERADRMGMDVNVPTDISKPLGAISFEAGKVNSPETYFGSARNEYLANGSSAIGERKFTLPDTFLLNKLYLSGKWNFTSEYITNVDTASIVFPYNAKNVYMVTSSDVGIDVDIYKDDIFVKKLNIKDEQLYTLIEGVDYGAHTLRIEIPRAGLKAFTFTFG